MQAITTVYRGYRFRSRLEARWAVYFDVLGLAWEYEVEGYHTRHGMYLPDFWLPQVDAWAEVKAQPLTEAETLVIYDLVESAWLSQHKPNKCLLLVGPPKPHSYAMVEYTTTDSSGGLLEVAVAISNYHSYPSQEGRFYSYPDPSDFQPDGLCNDVIDACNAALSARFEHGDNGAPRRL